MFYTLTNRDGQETLSVIGESFEKVIASTHPNFEALVSYLMTTQPHDEEYVRGLVDPAVGIGRVLAEHFGDRVKYDLYNLYLDGQPVQGGIARAIKQRMLAKDQDWLRFVRFLVNLDRNPSRRAQQAVWAWVEHHGLTITEDGRFLGYKAVLDNGLSSSSGPMNFVNGELLNGGAHCQVPHEIGSVISKKRADVDDTPGGGCSVGLHVGSYEYAKNFAPRLMTVAVNPEHVVSAPDDGSLDWKIRVCEYEVISLADPVQFASTSYDLQQSVEEPVVKSEERQAKEAALANLSEDERREYDFNRSHGLSHADALQAVWDSVPSVDPQDEEDDPFEDEEDHVWDQSLLDLEVEEEALAGEEPAAGEVAGGTSPDLTLAENAALDGNLLQDLMDPSLGHKPLARKWSHLTTEASVRRYRKANGITVNLRAKMGL